jgi:large subunit ribosomal protein L17
MRHAKKGRKLGTDASHTRAMLRSLAAALLANERIKTTETRAKEVRTLVDRIITWGKRGDVHSRRLALAELGDQALVKKVFDDIAPRGADREGGYTRILKLGPRKGDAAPMVIMELVD